VRDEHVNVFVKIELDEEAIQGLFEARVNLIFWNAIALDVLIDFVLVVTVIAEGVEYLSQGQMGQTIRDLLWCEATAPKLNNRTDWRASAADNWLTAEYRGITGDIAVGRRDHSYLNTNCSIYAAVKCKRI